MNQLQLDKVFVRIGHRFPPFTISITELRDSVANGKIDPDQAFVCFRGSETWHRLSSNLNIFSTKKEKIRRDRPGEDPLGKLVLSVLIFTVLGLSSVIIWWLTDEVAR